MAVLLLLNQNFLSDLAGIDAKRHLSIIKTHASFKAYSIRFRLIFILNKTL